MALFFVIHKAGSRSQPSNYRGISILCALAKLYDAILNSRLQKWFQPEIEQAGAQKGRGCCEHITALRLLVDTARKSRKTLYCVFVDFAKAYDCLPRQKLIQLLDHEGCGSRMLNALAESLRYTRCQIGKEHFQTDNGVRQGGSTYCSIFVFFANPLLRALKSYGPDGWLGSLNALMFMDDTIILGTSRQAIESKLNILSEYCQEYGMTINTKKTKYMVVNYNDQQPFMIDGNPISRVDSYCYLGATISGDSISKQVVNETKRKQLHERKFYSFLTHHKVAPYCVKKSCVAQCHAQCH